MRPPTAAWRPFIARPVGNFYNRHAMEISSMRVVVNGNEQQLDAGTTVAGLIASFKFQPKHVAVEINRELVPRRTFDSVQLAEGDHVEIVTLVGGGDKG